SPPPARPAPHTLSLHDALPISPPCPASVTAPSEPATTRSTTPSLLTSPAAIADARSSKATFAPDTKVDAALSRKIVQPASPGSRSEEHTSELQSRGHLVCRLLL